MAIKKFILTYPRCNGKTERYLTEIFRNWEEGKVCEYLGKDKNLIIMDKKEYEKLTKQSKQLHTLADVLSGCIFFNKTVNKNNFDLIEVKLPKDKIDLIEELLGEK